MPRYYKRFHDVSRGDSDDDRGTSTRYVEVGNDRCATRQIEVYENGTVLKYDEELVFDDHGGLADQPIDVEEYAEFEISADHFERAWTSTKASNRRRWLTRSSLLSGSSSGTAIATIVFGAIPATTLLLFALQILLFDEMRTLGRSGALSGQTLDVLIGFVWLVLAALGTLGVWRVSAMRRFVSRTNFYLLAAGLLAIWPLMLRVLALSSDLSMASGSDWEWLGLLFFVGSPVLTAFVYLVAMVILYARGRDTW